MKTIFRTLALSAAFLSMFTACQREELEQNQEPETPKTHTVTFVAGSPETKTTVDISDGKTAKFAWTKEDENRFVVYENGEQAKETSGILGADGLMTLTATFNGNGPESPSYQALYNTGVSSTQTANDLYDETADVLVSAVLTDTDRKAAGYLFSFKRESAIAKMTLKGLTDGVFVSSVTIKSDKDIAGTYDLANGIFTSTSNTITIKTLSEINNEGVATVWFASVPVEDATFTVTATTVDNEANVVATYTKTFTKTISLTRGDVKGFGVAMQEVVLSSSWEATDLANINETMPVVITMANSNKVYALSLTGTDEKPLGATEDPKAIEVSVIDGKLSNEPDSDILWNIANNEGNLKIYPNGIKDKWLYTTTANDGVRLGEKTDKGYTWQLDNSFGYLMANDGTNDRYLGVFNSKDWRTYKLKSDGTIADNIKGQTLCFYTKCITKQIPAPKNLKVSESKVVTWDVVAGAASYTLTIGSKEYMCQTNTFDASDDALEIEDDYYTVSVVAIPSDTDKYDASTATTLTDAKFGTPTLATPSLEAGSVSEFSVNATWTVDSRAKNGYNCELYQGETKVGDSQTVKTGSVTFYNLDDGVTYTLKVNAIAVVDGTKAYAASPVAESKLTTKGTVTLSQITKAGTYTVKNVTVYAVIGTSTAVIGDGTAYFYLYMPSHRLDIGDTFTVVGTVSAYSNYGGILQFNSPTIKNKVSGSDPTYKNAVEADGTYLTSYASAPITEYIHAKGTQSGQNITVGSQKLYLSTANSATNGKDVEVYGFVYGYNSSSKYAYFYATSITEDHTVPKLSVTPTSKTWKYNETGAFEIYVTTNTEGVKDWTVSPETLDWASLTVDKTAGTIIITPNGENRTGAAYQTTLTVTHSANATLKQEISLTQETFITVAGVSLDQPELSLAVGKTATLKATVNPSNATNQKVTWSSNDESVASVDGNGVVKAVAEGTATITVTTEDGRYTDDCTVNVAASNTKQYTLTITKDSFNSKSYAANNNDKTTKAVAEDNSSPIDVTWNSNQIMLQSSVMQWQKNAGYLYNKTDLGEIISVTVKSTEGSFTTYYGNAQNPTSGTTVGGGYFKVQVGSATGKTSSVVIVFKK